MRGWKNSAGVRKLRKEQPENRKQEKKKLPRKKRQGPREVITGMKEERITEATGRRTAARRAAGRRAAVRTVAGQTGRSPEIRETTDRRVDARTQGRPEATGRRADLVKARAVRALAAARGLAKALTVMQMAADLAAIVTVLRETVHRAQAEGRTLNVPRTINSGSLRRAARVLSPKARLKKARSTGTKKSAAAARRGINAPGKTSFTKRTMRQRTN